MILGVGTDIIEIKRIAKKLEGESGLKNALFTNSEIVYCESKHFPAQHFAARFAAKESLFKAIGTGWRDGMRYIEIEITNDELGKPGIETYGKVKDKLDGLRVTDVHLSLSHTKEYANAIVVIQ